MSRVTARNVKLRLSQVLGAAKKGYAVDTFEGKFPVVQTMASLQAASDTYVLASTTLAAAAQTVTSGITSPDAYRGLTVKGNQASVYGNVVVTGKDWSNRVIQETILASGTGTVQGNLPFASVASIQLPAKVATNDAISVGISSKLGLYRPTTASGDLVLTEKRQVNTYNVDTAATANYTYNTVVPNGGVGAGESFRFHYYTDVF